MNPGTYKRKTIHTRKKPETRKAKIFKPHDPKKANLYFILFFFILAFILYGNTVFNKYAVDDEYVTGPSNETVKKGLKAIPEIFSTFYVSKTGNVGSQNTDYRPIVKLTYALEFQLWGGDKPGMSHAINILIYFLLCSLLFFILKRLFRNYNILFPFLITVAFMVHPVHTEVVASLKNRDEMLAFLCGLGGLYYFLRYAEQKKFRFFSYALFIFFIGCLCKSSILPFLLLYPLALYFFTDMPPRKFINIIISTLVVVIIVQLVPRLFLPHVSRVNSFIENPLFFEKNFWIRTGTGMVSLLFYLKILIYPYPLSYYYGYDMIPVTGWWNIWVILSFNIHLGLFSYAIYTFRQKHVLSFAILFYLIAIAMYSNILVPVAGIVGERFVFTASFGFSIALVFLIFKLFRTEPNSLTIEFNERAKILAVVILLLVPCAYLTIKRNPDWRNMLDLSASDVGHLEKSAKANIQFAGLLMNRVYKAKPDDQQKMIQEYTPVIISYFKKGLHIYPDNYLTLNDLATVYLNFAQQTDSAVLFLRKAIALDPKLQPAWVNLGLAYRKLQQYDSAIFCYKKILELNPKEIKATFAIANIYADLGDYTKAIRMNEDAMKTNPNLDVPYINIGSYYILHGDTATAVQYWSQAAQKNPSYEICLRLSQLYRIKIDTEKANYYYRLALDALKNMNKE